jgi:aldose 1-epimerase
MTINGGKHSWGRMSFDIPAHTKNSITFVVFDYSGKNGFPGTIYSSLTHTVTPYEWRIAYGVTPAVAKSPVSLSNQVFWNLDGFARESVKTVADHTLHLPFSGLRLAIDQDGIPTGDIYGNKKNSTYNFWSASRPLGIGMTKADSGYNDTFLISRSQPWDWNAKPVATLASPHSGIKLDLYTDQEAVHVLTWNEEDGDQALCIHHLSSPSC